MHINFIFFHETLKFSQHHLFKELLFFALFHGKSFFVINWLSTYMRLYYQMFSCYPQSSHIPVTCCFNYNISGDHTLVSRPETGMMQRLGEKTELEKNQGFKGRQPHRLRFLTVLHIYCLKAVNMRRRRTTFLGQMLIFIFLCQTFSEPRVLDGLGKHISNRFSLIYFLEEEAEAEKLQDLTCQLFCLKGSLNYLTALLYLSRPQHYILIVQIQHNTFQFPIAQKAFGYFKCLMALQNFINDSLKSLRNVSRFLQ